MADKNKVRHTNGMNMHEMVEHKRGYNCGTFNCPEEPKQKPVFTNRFPDPEQPDPSLNTWEEIGDWHQTTAGKQLESVLEDFVPMPHRQGVIMGYVSVLLIEMISLAVQKERDRIIEALQQGKGYQPGAPGHVIPYSFYETLNVISNKQKGEE